MQVGQIVKVVDSKHPLYELEGRIVNDYGLNASLPVEFPNDITGKFSYGQVMLLEGSIDTRIANLLDSLDKIAWKYAYDSGLLDDKDTDFELSTSIKNFLSNVIDDLIKTIDKKYVEEMNRDIETEQYNLGICNDVPIIVEKVLSLASVEDKRKLKENVGDGVVSSLYIDKVRFIFFEGYYYDSTLDAYIEVL